KLKEHYSAAEIEPLANAIARLSQLDNLEDSLEGSISKAEQAREAELDRLLSALVWAGDWLAEEMVESGQRDEAARISLWVRNMATQYSEVAVRESLDGLDAEMGRGIA